MIRHALGSTAIIYWTLDSAGVGATGQSPTVTLQRVTDSKYYDDSLASGSRFAVAVKTNAMTEVDATNFPGLYKYVFPHTEDATGSEFFLVRFKNAGTPVKLAHEELGFGKLRSASVASLCNLYGTVVDVSKNSVHNALVRVSILPNNFLSTAAKEGVATGALDVRTDASGEFGIDLLQGLVVRLEIPAIGYDKKITIPASASVNFATL